MAEQHQLVHPGLASDPRWQLVERILASPAFQKSARLRDLLSYLSEQSLAGHTHDLTEQHIGQAVFQKAADYTTVEDSSVRVHVRQLRLKLHEYFDGEGRNERLVLEIPKGGYVPVFREVNRPIERLAVETKVESARSIRLSVLLPWLIIAVLIILCTFLWRRGAQAQQAEVKSPVSPWPLSLVFSNLHRTQIVVADSNYGMLRIIGRKPGSLDEYLKPNFQQQFLPAHPGGRDARIVDYITNSLLTSYADVAVLTQLLDLAGGARERVSVRSARDLRLRDLDDGNYIFIGSPGSNPWVELFENKLNFQETEGVVGEDMKYFRNKQKRPGEQDRYQGLRWTGTSGEDYATLAVLPNERRQGNILIIQGLQQEGTEAAGLFLGNEENRQRLRQALGTGENPQQPRYFEVLFRTRAVAGAPNSTSIVATRTIQP